MKKFISLMLAAAMALSVFAVSAFAEEKTSFKVAIVQQLDHASLDEIRTAAEAKLLALAEEKGAGSQGFQRPERRHRPQPDRRTGG